MGHKTKKKYNIKNDITGNKYYRNYNDDIFKGIKSTKGNLDSIIGDYSKKLSKTIKLPKPNSKSGKLVKKAAIGGSVLIMIGFTIGFPVTICLCLLTLFLLIYK